MFANDKAIWCGCVELSFKTWREEYLEPGRANDYSETQLQEYAMYFEICEKRFASTTVETQKEVG